MNNLPLQPLVWFDGGDTYGGDNLHADSPLHYYVVEKDTLDMFTVRYAPNSGAAKYATGFATIDDAKAWAWNHYNEKMQPYVKPMPTWISVDDRLPEEDGLYFAFYPSCIHERQVISFSSNIKRFNLFHDSVTHWMLLPNPPEFSTMQDLHKGGDCE